MNSSSGRYRCTDIRLLRRDFLKLGAVATGIFFNPLSAIAAFDSRSNPLKKLAFYNTHTHERLHVCYYRNGKYDVKALSKINHILRDHRADQVHPIDPALLDFLYDLLTKMGYHGRVHIISGYRSPETNKKLRKKSSGVAAGSLHMQGKALDFRLPGVDTKVLRDTARSMERGGVGYYKKMDFIQIDTGRVRVW